jgi:hypothetical protein
MNDLHHRPDDVYIATMGMTSSRESSLIATCCPEAAVGIGHELESGINGCLFMPRKCR